MQGQDPAGDVPRGPAPATDDRAVDRDELLDRVDGDLELVGHLRELYRRDFPDALQEIDAAIRAEDPDGLQRAAHRLKGMVANLAGRPSTRRCGWNRWRDPES